MLPDWAQKILQIVPEIKNGIKKGIFLTFLYELIKFIPIVLIKYIIDYFIAGGTDLQKLAFLIIGILVAYLTLQLIDNFSQKARQKWILHYETTILRKAKKKLLELHLGYHESLNTGAQVSKITKGAHKLTELIWFIFEEFIPTLSQLVITLSLLLYEQWILAAIFAFFIPIILLITIYASRKIQPYREKYHRKYEEAIGELGESLLNITSVKDYVQEKRQFLRFNHSLQEYSTNALLRWKVSLSILFYRDLFINLGRALTLATAAYLVIEGTLSPGSLVLVYTLIERAFLGTHRIGRLYNYLEDAMESINRLTALLQEQPTIKNDPQALSIQKLAGEIDFRDVTFSYGSKFEVLKDFNLHINPKQVVALVGKSGSGKTTIAKLLLRNYDLSHGQILVDQRNIKDYKIENYKARIAVVSQNVEIFNRSIAENILFANPSASKAQVIAVAKKAYAHEFIANFPQGYDTVVGEKGVRLSGGQKQRISIARALLKTPDIYIFDEATSSLDTESEQYIQKSIFSIAGKKTTIIIAHRLSTIKHADLIVVMDQGKVMEQGSYQELIQQKGLFAKMISLQNISELRE